MKNKKMFFSKKASGYILGKKPLYFIILLICLTISFILFSYAISREVSSTTYILENLEVTILINRFLNSPDCLAYQDKETGRTYSGVIDLEKFNDKTLEKCYSTEDNDLKAFKLTLESSNPNIPIKENSDDKTFILTPNWEPRRYTQTSQYVLIHYKENFYRGRLLIAVQK
jgi:hypothetical protein